MEPGPLSYAGIVLKSGRPRSAPDLSVPSGSEDPSSSPNSRPYCCGSPVPSSTEMLTSPVSGSISVVMVRPSSSITALPSAPASTGVAPPADGALPGVVPAPAPAPAPPWPERAWEIAAAPFAPISALAASGFLLKSRS